jgi:hypothetical protein
MALDGTKIKASASKKRHITKKKLKAGSERADAKAREFLAAMDKSDDIEKKEELKDKADRYSKRSAAYKDQIGCLDKAG